MRTGTRVAVVGAGPVGVSTALLLAKWGVSVVVIEARKRSEFVRGSKAVGMQQDVMEIFARIGCAEEMLQRGLPLEVSQTHNGSVLLQEQTFSSDGESGFPSFLQIPQSVTEQLLLDLAERNPLVELRLSQKVIAVEDGEEAVNVVATDLVNHREEVLAVDYVIGCDGSRSTVRKLAGFEFPGDTVDDQFLILDVAVSDSFLDRLNIPRGRHFYFNPPWNEEDDQFLMSPQPDGVWRMDWHVSSSFDVAEAEASGDLRRRVREVVGHDHFSINWASVYSFQQRCADAFRRGRIFLAGDAAHLFAPFGGRGMNSGMFDAENIAWKIGLAKALPSESEEREHLLASYESERRAAALENLSIVRKTLDFLLPSTPQALRRRQELLQGTLTLDHRAGSIDSGNLSVPTIYHDSPLIGVPEESTSVGPQPGELVPDFSCTIQAFPAVERFRQLVGRHYTVIIAGNGEWEPEHTIGAPVPGAPMRIIRTVEFDDASNVAQCLGLTAGEYCIVRPDGYVGMRGFSRKRVRARAS